MKNLHRLSGIIVSVFILIHLSNHLFAWFGIEKHQYFLEKARIVYQNPWIEPLLLFCFAFQAISGIILFYKVRKDQNVSKIQKLQAYSGLILGLFLIQHISVSVSQRIIGEIDTNFFFAAYVVLEWPLKIYFIPYYFLGVVSLGLHIAITHRMKISKFIGAQKATIHFYIILTVFTIIALIVLYLLLGGHYPIEIPEVYKMF